MIICDGGSGLRDLGKSLMALGPDMPKTFHIMMSQIHWDHIQGFPFFIPAYIQGVTINIYGCHSDIKKHLFVNKRNRHFQINLEKEGIYHLAVGKKVVSAYAGHADYSSFVQLDHTLSTSEASMKSVGQVQHENR